MCRVATAEFEPVPTSVTAARHWVGEHLRRWELRELTGPAEVLTSELVANAVVHAHSSPVVSAAVADGVLEVGVSDRDRRVAHVVGQQRAASKKVGGRPRLAGGGLGLVMVAALADEWGASGLTGGKQVWFRLNAADWSYRTACRCHTADVDRVRLESGRYALANLGPWDQPSASVLG